MPAPEDKTTSSAGISPAKEVDVAALFARLREEVGRGGDGGGPGGSRRRSARASARAVAERFWPVSAERPLERQPGLRGAVLRPVKRVLRKLMRWYVEPLAADQRAFNDAALKLIDELFEQVDREVASRGADARLLGEVEERLTRLERRRPSTGTVAAQPAAAAVPDYFAFESRMRGATAEIRERQRVYVDDFRDAAPVLDVGCGRGEFLGLLRDAGIEARGVDADADMVAFTRGEGLEVEQADALTYLAGLENDSLGGVFAAQLVEHLPPPALLRLLELAREKLRPGGLLVAETINPLSPLALRSYFADLTHAQPLVPETLALLARQAGFAEVETRFLNTPPAAARLQPVELPPDSAFDAARAALDENVRLLNEQLFGPLDYAVLARA